MAVSEKLQGRNPLTLAPVAVEGINPQDYLNSLVLVPSDLRFLAELRGLLAVEFCSIPQTSMRPMAWPVMIFR